MYSPEEKIYVVCHMLTSLDGKIDGSFMRDPACGPALSAYGSLRSFFSCQATLYGTVSMLGSFCDGPVGALPDTAEPLDRVDHIASHDVDQYIISVDPRGELGFSGPYIEKKGRARAHLVQVLLESVSDRYLHYLRQLGISYIFAGTDNLDCRLLLQKLREGLGIRRLMIAGGGYMNYSFLHEGLIDELSIVIAPLADGNTQSVSIFERSDFLKPQRAAVFTLVEASPMKDTLWLRYRTRNQGAAE